MQSRFSWDELRRFAAALMAKRGLAPAKASALATHLLWFEAIGATAWGFASLRDVLESLGRKEWNPSGDAKFESERAAIASINGQNGVPALLAAQAATVAGEKARDFGMGRVRLRNIQDPGPLAPFVAELAIGPQIAFMVGPGPVWAFALPSANGLPLIYDSRLALANDVNDCDAPWHAWKSFAPWIGLQRDREWVVLAMTLDSSDSLSDYHERLNAIFENGENRDRPGFVYPEVWADRRENLQLRGIPLQDDVRDFLAREAQTQGIAAPMDLAEL